MLVLLHIQEDDWVVTHLFCKNITMAYESPLHEKILAIPK